MQNDYVLIDSGIFDLIMQHSNKHKLDFNQTLGLQPHEIDGFDNLWLRYIRALEQYGEQSWGYIEMDIGGKETKCRLRAKLESMGFNPIPVYHPLNDGWDYFDYLAENYDRICVGNISQANQPTKLRIISTVWQRKQKYPHLWIHLLGYTPNEWAHAYPCESSDSSSWLSSVKYPTGLNETADGANLGSVFRELQYELDAEPRSNKGRNKGIKLASYVEVLHMINIYDHRKEIDILCQR